MKYKFFINILCSLPIILLFLYFIPFLGVCLVIVRCIIDINNRKYLPFWIFLIGLLILVPKVIYKICSLLKCNIDYLNEIVYSDTYIKLIHYSKFLICVGIIFMIISYIFRLILNKSKNFVKSYINDQEKRDAEISLENDMKIKIKQEQAKNTKVVHCPFCGADNILTEKIGTCNYCRRKIS